jgi:hypothetical protein
MSEGVALEKAGEMDEGMIKSPMRSARDMMGFNCQTMNLTVVLLL